MIPWQTILAIESDKHAAAVYAANMPETLVACDLVSVERVEAIDGRTCDVVCGGPPCQPFSVAGKGGGKSDDRDGLPVFLACAEALRPRHVIMENVPGILSEEHWPHFTAFLLGLEALGYSVEWRKLDAFQFGVPQFRDRVWTWGIRKDTGCRHVWPLPTHAPPNEIGGLFGSLLPWVTVREALELGGHAAAIDLGHGNKRETDADLDKPAPTMRSARGITGCGDLIGTFDAQNKTAHSVDRPIGTIQGEAQAKGGKAGQYLIQSHADPPRTVDEPASALRSGGAGHDGCCVRIIGGGHNPAVPGDARTERDITDEPCTTLPANGGNAVPGLAYVYRHSDAMLQRHPPARLDEPSPTVMAKFAKGGAEGLVVAPSRDGRPWDSRHPVAEPGEPAPTVRARSPRDGGRCTENVVRDGLIVRRLTPVECARLQSVPDDFVWPSSVPKTARYRIIGNGWACLMARRISECVRASDPEARTVVDLFAGGGLGAVGWHGRAWERRGCP